MARKSKQREAILKAVKCTKCHPTAEWVYGQVRSEIPNISLGTVYRNLKLLAHNGEIIELNGIDNVGRYDGTIENHYHFRCEKCNRVFDIDRTIDPALNIKLAQQIGFMVKRHSIEFYGLCQDCR